MSLLARFRPEPGAKLCVLCAVGWPRWLVIRHLDRLKARW